MTTPAYRLGTQRLVSPEQTRDLLRPHWSEFGITRCAEVTQLDVDLGMPVCMAIRPRGRVLQSSAGKGLTKAAAQVSALMEAVELDIAERPNEDRFRYASQTELEAQGLRVDALPENIIASKRHFSRHFRTYWVEAEDLLQGGPVWVPAGAAYFFEPTPCRTNTNGLASGNHRLEATLHGLYEVIERDAMARAVRDGKLNIARDCDVIDTASIEDPALARVIAKIEHAASKVVLLRLKCGLNVPTFWALLLNQQPFAAISTLSSGQGTHTDAVIAMSRAIGEAVQTRLTMIHGARDDIVSRRVYAAQMAGDNDIRDQAAYRFFDALDPSVRFDERRDESDFETALATILSLVQDAGHTRVYRVDLQCPVPAFSVVKIITPTLKFDAKLF